MASETGNLIGYVGTALIVGSYFLNQAGRLTSDDWRYPSLNLLGSLLMIVSLQFSMNWPSLAIELFWTAISLFGLWRSLRA